MSDQVWLGWIGLAAGVLGPIALAIAGWIKSRSMSEKIAEVHTIVNKQRSDMMEEIDDLKKQVIVLKGQKPDQQDFPGATHP
jgi:hypothetical protein